jgi:serine/threonine protein kinase
LPYQVPLETAKADFPELDFIEALTPSEQKCAFHVRNADGRSLCLKLIAPDYNLDRLSREIRALQEIDHPNVVRFVEYTYSSKPSTLRHYVVEEFIPGSDLADELQGPRWDLPRAAKFFAALADGLDALRQAQVVHRDLKPHNIRVRQDGAPVIIDFGLARHLALPSLTHTAQGAGIGTPMYFAPEQFDGTKHDIDHRTDLFAVGVILHEAIVGRHPFATPWMTTAGQLRAAVCDRAGFKASAEFEALPTPRSRARHCPPERDPRCGPRSASAGCPGRSS